MGLRNLFTRAITDPLTAVRALRSPDKRRVITHTIGREVNKLYHSRGGIRKGNPAGADIFEEDWDNLIILDAYRYDSMKRAKAEFDLPRRLESRISRGSQTPEWLKTNFDERQLHDTVYVSSGAMPYSLGVADPEEPTPRQRRYGFNLDVHDLINVWKEPPEGSREVEKEEQSHVITAETMCEASRQAAEEYPSKRLIFHFSQPHEPYFGPTGLEIHEQTDNPWHAKLAGKLDVSVATLREMYRENVDISTTAAKELAASLGGKTVVAADHGELLYERSAPVPILEYMHPDRTYVDELVKVPWVVIEGERRDITAERPKSYTESSDDDSVQDQLAALGYVD